MDRVKKKILLISSEDGNGGAQEAIVNVAYLLMQDGHNVKLVVKKKWKSNSFTIEYLNESKKFNLFQKLLLKIINKFENKYTKSNYKNEYSFKSIDEKSENIDCSMLIKQIGFTPEIIISGFSINFINTTDLLKLQKFTKAAVYNITMDMNNFTGGCHYAWDCKGYLKGCNSDCPAILNKKYRNIAKDNFDLKLKNAKEGNFKIIAASGWTLKQVKESKIYKNQDTFFNVNSLIDTSLFNNKLRDVAKQIFNFSNDRFYILTGSLNTEDPRKGTSYFFESLKILESKLSIEQRKQIVILVVSNTISKDFDELNYQTEKINFIRDYRLLSILYQSVNIFVNTSIEDSGPMMVSEALACGTPVVGFNMGIVTNMVINGYNGYKAKLKDSDDLAAGIFQLFNMKKDEYDTYSKNASIQIKEFSSFEYAQRTFNEIFDKI